MTSSAEFAISETLADILDGLLVDLGVSLPDSAPFMEGSETEEQGDGHIRVSGFGVASWRYSFLAREERDILKAFCPAPNYSSEVYIRTLNQENEWQTMKVIMLWQNGEAFDGELPIEFVINFKVLQVYEDA